MKCHSVSFGYFQCFAEKRGSSCVKVILQILLDISVEKVILVICGPGTLLSLKDEAIFTEKVGGIFQGTGKGIVVWMKHSLFTVEPDVLAQMVMAPGSPFKSTKPQTSYRDDFSRPRYSPLTLMELTLDRNKLEEVTRDFHSMKCVMVVTRARKIELCINHKASYQVR